MALLISYVLFALVFSFLCSIAEAVLLSVTAPYVAVLEKQGKPYGPVLRQLKSNINKPLAAILTLNTIAHTIGAAGAGAQVAIVFGNTYLGIASAILTLLILFLSEIIPKTLGAHHWRKLAPATAYGLKFLIILLYPFVKLTEKMMKGLSESATLNGFSRQEFSAMADLSAQEGQLTHRESEVLKNLLLLRETSVKDAMTPRTVVFSLPESTTVADFFRDHEQVRFSRIPVYSDESDHVEGFVLRSDLLLAQARNNTDNTLNTYSRELSALMDTTALSDSFDEVLHQRAHIMRIVDEYGGMEGIITMEDILETLLGLEIIDEGDKTVDMQQYARQLWKKRAQAMGITITNKDGDF